MQRKATKQTRGANALERLHMQLIKERQVCAACGLRGPVINHHMYGAAAKVKVDFETVLIGHAAVIGLCQHCDNIVTRGSRRALVNAFGPQCDLWAKQLRNLHIKMPDEVIRGIFIYERGRY